MEINKLTKEQLVPQYLMHSYLYYIEGKPVLSDRSYDLLCIRLLAEWNEVEHPHKDIVDKESLSSGTGFYLKEEDYPLIVKMASRHYFLTDTHCGGCETLVDVDKDGDCEVCGQRTHKVGVQ